MSLLCDLLEQSKDPGAPFLMGGDRALNLRDVVEAIPHCEEVAPGDVVALVGDFDAPSIASLFMLADRGAVIMPLTDASKAQHSYFFEAGHVKAIMRNGSLTILNSRAPSHPLIQTLRDKGHAGLILFSSGSTGRPKAILHDLSRFLVRYKTPRPAWATLSFLLFDHIGGLNTLLHALYNGGRVIRPSARSPHAIVEDIRRYGIELLPATPTFLRLWALEGMPDPADIPSLKLITYGTERMDQHTLSLVADSLPGVDIRQTYGMSELGIFRVRTRRRDELWIQAGGEGVEITVRGSELFIRAENRMEGYLNAPSPFDAEGWYGTRDLVETDGPWLRIVGRRDSVINVGGLKVLPSEVEHAALSFSGIVLAKAEGRPNPITGMHVELRCQPEDGVLIDMAAFRRHLGERLPSHAVPLRISFTDVPVSHRFKQL